MTIANDSKKPSSPPSLASGQYRHLARLTGYSAQHITRSLQGHNGLTLVSAKRIATAAGVTLEQLYDHMYSTDADEKANIAAIVSKREKAKVKGKITKLVG